MNSCVSTLSSSWMIRSGHLQYERLRVLGMKSSCTITRLQGGQCMLLLLLVCFPPLLPMTSVLMSALYLPVCHPTLRTDWFLKLGENGHTRALTVFKHVYEEYASNTPPPEDQPATNNEFDSDSDNGILGSAAARPVIAQTRSHPESQSEFTRWVANEGGPGKMNYPLVWWKVCPYYTCPALKFTTVLHIRLTQKSSRSSREWHKTFSQSWEHLSQ
jgi:hypothetical protein